MKWSQLVWVCVELIIDSFVPELYHCLFCVHHVTIRCALVVCVSVLFVRVLSSAVKVRHCVKMEAAILYLCEMWDFYRKCFCAVIAHHSLCSFHHERQSPPLLLSPKINRQNYNTAVGKVNTDISSNNNIDRISKTKLFADSTYVEIFFLYIYVAILRLLFWKSYRFNAVMALLHANSVMTKKIIKATLESSHNNVNNTRGEQY